jgi:hypothetical protein
MTDQLDKLIMSLAGDAAGDAAGVQLPPRISNIGEKISTRLLE